LEVKEFPHILSNNFVRSRCDVATTRVYGQPPASPVPS
jgi:hypothetical protein